MKKYVKMLFAVILIFSISFSIVSCNKDNNDNIPQNYTVLSDIELKISDLVLSGKLEYKDIVSNASIDNPDILIEEDSDISYLLDEDKNIIIDSVKIPFQIFYSNITNSFLIYKITLDNSCSNIGVFINGMELGKQTQDDFLKKVSPTSYSLIKEIDNINVYNLEFDTYDCYLTFENNVLNKIELIYKMVVPARFDNQTQNSIIVSHIDEETGLTSYTQYIFDNTGEEFAYVDTRPTDDTAYGELYIVANCKVFTSENGKSFTFKEEKENPVVDFGDMGNFAYDIYYSSVDIFLYENGNLLDGQLFLVAGGV